MIARHYSSKKSLKRSNIQNITFGREEGEKVVENSETEPNPARLFGILGSMNYLKIEKNGRR